MAAKFNEGRRSILGKLGGAALALPFLELNRSAHAAAPVPGAPMGGKIAKNLIVFYTPNGVYHPNYWPSGTEREFTLNIAMEALGKYKDKLVIVGPQFAPGSKTPTGGTGLKHLVKNAGAGGNPPQHQAQVFMTGDPVRVNYNQQTGDGLTVHTSQPSLDQMIGKVISAGKRFNSLEFGLHPVGGDTPSTINFAMDGSPMPRIQDPAKAFAMIFAGVSATPVMGGGAIKPTGPDPRRVAVSNFLHHRFDSISPRLGATDRMALQGHLDAIREVEKRVLAAPTAATASCEPSKLMLQQVPQAAAFMEVPSVSVNFHSIIAMAMACDITRVSTITYGYPGGGGVGGLHPVWLGIPDAHHAMSHHGGDPDKTGKLTKLMNWFGSQVANMLDELAKYPHPDGDGTLLDHTVVFWGSRHGEGNGHTNENIPCLLAGGGTAVFGQPGRFINLPGTNWCSLLLSLAKAYGVQADTFGQGPLKATETIKELGV